MRTYTNNYPVDSTMSEKVLVPARLQNSNYCLDKFAARVFCEIKVIVKQIVRFSRMAPKERLTYMRAHPEEAFRHIPHPQGQGVIFCGAVAFERFLRLSKLIVDIDKDFERRIELSAIRKMFIDSFVARVLKEKRDVDLLTSALILEDVLSKLKATLIDTEHFLPCVFFPHGGPDQFDIGPVRFTRMRRFFKQRRGSLRSSLKVSIASQISHVDAWAYKVGSRRGLMEEADSERFVRNLQARVFKTFRAYPWVAEVKVTRCEKDVAEDFSVKTAVAALHIVRILLGSGVTRRVRLAWSKGDTLRTARMWADESGEINVSASSNGMTPVGAENWYDGLSQGDGRTLAKLGSAIGVLCDPRPIFNLHQRLLDSIHWFGDAATEPEPTSRIIKFTSGIERLIFGKFQRGQKIQFAKRLQEITRYFFGVEETNIYQKAISVYTARSALLHGDWSPRHQDAHELAGFAEHLCYFSIIGMAELFPAVLRVDGDISPNDLDRLMQNLAEHGESALDRYGLVAP